jgi:hypothetical protein
LTRCTRSSKSPPTGNGSADAELRADHERFIDRLDEANTVVLGGSWRPPTAGFEAAYLASCGALDEARGIAASDPLVGARAICCEVIEWELVGVNLAAAFLARRLTTIRYLPRCSALNPRCLLVA